MSDQKTPAEELLELLKNPFKQPLTDGAIWSALGTSLGITAITALIFSLVRPYHTVIYAPKLKHADEKHAPPPIGKGFFAWIMPLWRTSEKDLVAHAGMDAALFIRVMQMCRNIFLVIAVLGTSVLLPVYWTLNSDRGPLQKWFLRFTPANVFGKPIWALVVIGQVFRLRRTYFESEEYQRSLSARTLMLNDIPKNMASDEGVARIIDSAAPQSSFSRTVIARNVKLIPSLIDQHDHTVRKLEKVLAKYLKDPQNLPAARPVCYPSKKDPSYATYPKGQKIDAIDYLTQRIRELELEIKEVRNSLDKRHTLSYGFASYDDISEAHAIAYTLRKKKPLGATVVLAPKPDDIIWDNMPLSPSTRSWRRLTNNLWIILLTFLWIGPNALIAIFVSNLSNLGLVWDAFRIQLSVNTAFWAIVQGVASPAVTSFIYLVLPIIFRRLSIRAGDRTKTGRDRHVVAKLYAFFIFNNLIVFSLFNTVWSFIVTVVDDTTKNGSDVGNAILNSKFFDTLFISLCQISAFWVTWLLQRNLGAAIDLAQLWPLIYSFFARKFSSPTPREMIELTAPPTFDYASYYNYFLFYSTVALCFGGLQPLVLPAAALYFSIDSGGMFWRTIYNRFVFGTILANLVTFLAVFVRGDGEHMQAYATVPLPFIMIIFKIYCARTFDAKIHFYSIQSVNKHPDTGALKDPLRSSNLAARFGHPALYRNLITPMVHAKAQNILVSIYRGRLSDGRTADSGDTGDTMSTSGYSDAYAMKPMNSTKPGKSAGVPGFELVPESRLDFEYYKNRSEFASDHGAGNLFGRSNDIMRPGTPGSMWDGSEPNSRSASPAPPVPRIPSPGPSRILSPASDIGMVYPTGYSRPMGSPYSPPVDVGQSRNPLYSQGNDSNSNLVGNAAPMPVASTPGFRERSVERLGRTPGGAGMLGGGPQGYGGLPQDEEITSPEHDPMQYNYFREARRPRRDHSGGW
ncbi:hypothetical protein GQX73_g4964 [Xylaria multiplex]|uniref:CSC1/OSCA1-like 7TM region domain-containing protein n=1 Tax=Xylaria multiplex TaxID=323545 RepID=A0A7C8MRE2_9PEZI|nr:hypothetical protein GQX73_g4964 [Xylaria multiplex]